MQQSEAIVQQARAILEQLTSTEGRLAVSAGVLVVTLLVAVLVLPLAVRQIRRALTSRYMTGQVGETVDIVGDYMPTSFSGLVLRLGQVTVLLGSVFALLIVWGLFEWAIAMVDIVSSAVPDLFKAGLTLLLLLLSFAASEQLKKAVSQLGDGSDRITEHQEEIILRVGQVALFVTVVASVLTLWGINLSGLLVGAGFLGIVVGFAARQTLGSLIAGFVLMFSRPFTIGDWVQIGDNEGIVTDITIFNTRLENFDGEFIIIPNDRVGDRPVTNRSRKGLLRLTVDVGVDYDADVDRAMDLALEAMADIEHVVESPAPDVVPKSFGDSAVVMECRFWIDHPTPPRKWRAVSAVVRGVKDAFDDEGVTIPFPQRTLSNREGAPLEAETDLGTTMRSDGDGDGDAQS